MTTREVIESYLQAVESHDLERVATWLHDEVVVVEHPNKLNPAGKTYDKAALRAAGEQGQALLEAEHYDIRHWVVDGDRAAVQIEWSATLKGGATMRAHICSCIVVKEGKIWRQEQYDCFLP